MGRVSLVQAGRDNGELGEVEGRTRNEILPPQIEIMVLNIKRHSVMYQKKWANIGRHVDTVGKGGPFRTAFSSYVFKFWGGKIICCRRKYGRVVQGKGKSTRWA